MFLTLLAACGSLSGSEADTMPAGGGGRLAETVPVVGGGLLALSDERTVLAADVVGGRLLRLDVVDRRITGELALQDQPNRMAEDAEGRVHVVVRTGGDVVTVDPESFEIDERTPVCPAPRGIAFDPFTDTLLVACAGGELVEIDDDGLEVLSTIVVAPDLRDVAVDPDGNRFVTTFRAAEVLEVAPGGEVLFRTTLPGTRSTTGQGPERRAARVAWDLLPHPAGGVVVLHQRHLLTPVPVPEPGDDDPERDELDGYGGDGSGCGPVVVSGVSRVVPGGEALAGPSFDQTSLAVDVTRTGDDLWVAAAGAATGEADILEFRSPEFLADREAGCVGARVSERVFGDLTVAVAFAGEQRVSMAQDPLVLAIDSSVVHLEGERSTGSRLFHQNPGLGVSCASCHPEGRDDGHVWEFEGIGPRRTQYLAVNGMSALAPYHWDGEFTAFDDLASDVFTERMGREEPVLPEESDALLGWIDGLRPVRVTPSGDDAAIARGEEVFASAGCASCHAGYWYASREPADVGTGGTYQVPSLVGIGLRAPYLHDGCAPTLAERFGPCGGADHGDPVYPMDVPDLVAYLETL